MFNADVITNENNNNNNKIITINGHLVQITRTEFS